MGPQDRESGRHVTRREFLKGSAALGAALAATGSAWAAAGRTPDRQPGDLLFLPPHLSCPTETTIRISALSDSHPAEGVIELRKAGKQDWQRGPAPLKVAAYQLLDWTVRELSPATRYEYRVLLRQGTDETFRPAATGSFITQRKGPASYMAVLMTDPHTGSFAPGTEPVRVLDKVVQNAARAKPEFVLDLGDNVAWAGSREFPQNDPGGATSAYAQYRRQIGPISRHAPFFAITGNWGGESGKFPERSIETVTAVRRALLPNPDHLTYRQGGSEREDYYAFTWGDALYVMLNIQTYSRPSQPNRLPNLMADVNRIEEWTLGEKQMAWFEQTLKKATERFRFVGIHHPAGGNAGDELNTLYGRGGARAWNTGEQVKIHNLMKTHKVQIFFYGHDHVFVDDVVDGIHYTLPGSCGAPWKFTKAETGYERFWPDSGHAQLDVTPEKATVTFFNLDNKILHSFSVPAA
jgi:predicted phosphodiesterase